MLAVNPIAFLQPDSGCPIAWSWQFSFQLPSQGSCGLLDAEGRCVEREMGAESCPAPSTACSPGSGRLKLEQVVLVLTADGLHSPLPGLSW